MKTYEIEISRITMLIEAEDEDEARSDAEQWLMNNVWDYGTVEVQ
jgi:hypothetical protein